MEGSALRGRKHPMKPAVSWHTTLPAKSSVFIPLATVGGGKGLFGAGTSTFRQPQNRRILARHALKFRICPGAKSACSGVGDAAVRREFWQKFLKRSSITGGAKGISSPVPPRRRYFSFSFS